MFFETMNEMGLVESYRVLNSVDQIPWTVSVKVTKKQDRIYYFIFANTSRFHIESVHYQYDEAINDGSDHALVT
jgi:hypothetical protein